MQLPFAVYVIDTETTGLDDSSNEIIELSILRLNDEVQRTWYIKPTKYDTITQDALRVNGHKLEDLKWQTTYGRETYRELSKVLPEIENFFMDDLEASDGRILVGQNVVFDLGFVRRLWEKANTLATFPFGDRPKVIDTIQLALLLDLIKGTREQYYNLTSLVERYGVKKEKAHKADSDTRMCKNVFLAQMKLIEPAIKKANIK